MSKTTLGKLPREQTQAVLEIARRIDAGDSRCKADIDSGANIAELVSRKYK